MTLEAPVDYWTNEAARKLNHRASIAGYGEFDPSAWLPWILEVLRALMVCKPDPAEAFEYLTWRPYWFTPFSAYRLRKHREGIREAVARGPRAVAVALARPYGAADPLDAVFAAIDSGDLTRPFLVNLYRERAGK